MSNNHINTILRAFSPRFLNKAIATFDKSTAVVVGAAWAISLVMILLAFYSFVAVGQVKREIAAAEAAEPALPQVVRTAADSKEIQPYIKVLEKNFPGLKFETRGKTDLLIISTADGSYFRDWLASLSYLDTIAPDYRWTIKEMCIGAVCGLNSVPLKVILTAEKISFTLPNSDK